jgi:hypothetical protein
MVTYTKTSSRRRRESAAGLTAVVASGLLATSLGVAPMAGAWCANISGLSLGSGCTASFGSIAIVLGPSSSTAIAGNSEDFSPFNLAISVGTNTHTGAGHIPSEDITGILNIGSVAFASAGSSAQSSGLINLAASFGGTGSSLTAIGVGNNALNLGSGNILFATGIVNHASVLLGDDNIVLAGNVGEGLEAILSGFNVAFNAVGDGNWVSAGATVFNPNGSGPLSIAGAIGLSLQQGAEAIINSDFGIVVRTPLNVQQVAPALATVKAAAQTLDTTSDNTPGEQPDAALKKADKQLKASLKKADKQLKASLKKADKQLKASLKKANDRLNASLNSLKKKASDTEADATGPSGSSDAS